MTGEADTSEPELSIIVPTHRRPDRLRLTLAALGPEAQAANAEVIVDRRRAPTTRPPAVLAELGAGFPAPLQHRPRSRSTPARASLATRESRSPGPRCWSSSATTSRRSGARSARHRAFHARAPGDDDALLGRIVPGAEADSPFARWLHDEGKQFAFGSLRADAPVPAPIFYAANCSLKRTLFDRAGGFDERFELRPRGARALATGCGAAGMRLAYDPAALAEHHHPTDLRRDAACGCAVSAARSGC